MSDEELIDLAHTILLRMAMRGGHDAYTGALLTKWLKAHEGRRTPRALDVARPRCKVCGTTDHHTDVVGNVIPNPPQRR